MRRSRPSRVTDRPTVAGSPPESAAEGRRAHQGDIVAPRQILFRAERSSQLRMHPERGEEPCRGACDGHPLRPFAALQRRRAGIDGPVAQKRLRVPQVVQFGHREPALAAPDSHEGPVHGDEAAFVVPAERPQQHAVDDAEDRGGRSDAERKRHHGGGGEAGSAEEAAGCKPEIAQDGVHRFPQSARSAAMGSIRVARSAGMPLAASATTASTAAITRYVSGSRAPTP